MTICTRCKTKFDDSNPVTTCPNCGNNKIMPFEEYRQRVLEQRRKKVAMQNQQNQQNQQGQQGQQGQGQMQGQPMQGQMHGQPMQHNNASDFMNNGPQNRAMPNSRNMNQNGNFNNGLNNNVVGPGIVDDYGSDYGYNQGDMQGNVQFNPMGNQLQDAAQQMAQNSAVGQQLQNTGNGTVEDTSTVVGWILIMVQMLVPIWNIIFSLKTIKDSTGTVPNWKKNYIKAYWIYFIACSVLSGVAAAALGK